MSSCKYSQMLCVLGSVAVAGISVALSAVCIGVIANVPILGSEYLVGMLNQYFQVHAFYNNPEAWARFYVGGASILAQVGVMTFITNALMVDPRKTNALETSHSRQ